ncbi:MAG: hypothetical protein Q7S36_02660 [Candidatus Liptonbacteria bacterium]|nr:hypothetical protein [Candidatus Liptonbacteria bacterium]
MKRLEGRVKAVDEAEKVTNLFDKLSLRDTRDLYRILRKIGGKGRRHLGSVSSDVLEMAITLKLHEREIKRGLADAKAGRTVSLEYVLRELESKKKK